MTSIRRIQTSQRMSQVVIAGNFVFLAGQLADSAHADVPQQTTEILQKIDTLLESAGANKASIVSCSIWLTASEDFNAFNQVWDAWVPAGHAPARACVASSLMKPGCNVEIAVTAYIPQSRVEA